MCDVAAIEKTRCYVQLIGATIGRIYGGNNLNEISHVKTGSNELSGALLKIADQIGASWHRVAQSIIDVGNLLIEAEQLAK